MTLDELKSALWGAAVLLRGKINATGYKEYIFPLVFFKRISDVHQEEYKKALELSGGDAEFAADKENYTFVIPEKCLWDDVREVTENVGQALVTAWTRIEQANPSKVVGDRVVEGLVGIFGKRDHWTNKNLLPDQTLSELIEHFSKLDLSIAVCPADEMGNAYEYLVGKFADDAGNTAQEFYTNRTVVELMAEILEPKAGESIYDPTCGTGGMLISCIARCKAHEENWREIKAYGQEQNALTSSVAKMNLFLHGVEEFRIINDDTLLRPGFLDAGQLKTFDVVLANPPYTIRHWNRELFANDPYGRNIIGIPPEKCADYAFIQHILCSMNPKTGRSTTLLPHGVLNRDAEAELRKNLVELDWIEAIIGLGRNLFYNSGLESCVLVCRRQKKPSRRGRILFIEAENNTHKEGKQAYLYQDDIAKILAAYHNDENIPELSAWATKEEILANNGNLNIKTYVKALTNNEERSLSDALVALQDSQKRLSSAFSAIGCELDGSPMNIVELSNEKCNWRRVRLSDVAEEYSVRVDNPSQSEYKYYIGSDCIDKYDFRISRRSPVDLITSAQKRFYKGDYLLVRRSLYGSDFRERAPRSDFDGCCSADILTIRAKTNKIEPGYLIKVLYEKELWDFIVSNATGGLTRRIKWKQIASYEFDLPPIERQKELAELLWAANDLKESYKKMITATDEMLKAKFREMFGECGRESAKGAGDKVIHDCQIVPLSEVGVISTGSTPSMKNRVYYENHDIPFYKPSDFSHELTSLDCSEFWLDARAERKVRMFHEGAVLVTCIGTIGRVGIAKRSGTCNQQINFIEPNESVYSLFLAHALQMMGEALSDKAKTSVVPIINKGEFSRIKIPLPPLSLQQEFVTIARKADETKAALKQSIADVEQVIKGLINE